MASTDMQAAVISTFTDPRDATTLGEMLSRAAARFGNKTALQVLRQGEWVQVSFTEMLARAQTWGQTLAIAPGDRVIIAAESSPEWGLAYFAATLCGAAVVPLDPQLSIADMQAIAARTQARYWLLSHAVAVRVRAELPASLPSIFEIEESLTIPAGMVGAALASSAITTDTIASLPFTSGTTLAPKGVPLTHKNFLANVRALLQVIVVDSRDEFLCVLPLHHVLAFTCSFLAPLSSAPQLPL